MTLLSRDAILKSQDFRTEDVSVPEWNGTVRIRTMTVAERDEFVKRVNGGDAVSVGAWLVSLLAIDEKGNQLFTEVDVDELRKKNFRPVDTVGKAILRLNQVDEAKIDEAEKNS